MRRIPYFSLCALILTAGCHEQGIKLDETFSPPIKLAETLDSLSGSVVLHKLNNSIIAIKPEQQLTATYYVMNSTDNSWSKALLTGVPTGYLWYLPIIDTDNSNICFDQSYKDDDQIEISTMVGRITVNDSVSVGGVTENKWSTKAKAIFGDSYPNAKLTEHVGARESPVFGVCAIHGQNFYFPYCLNGIFVNVTGKTVVTDGSNGPYQNGIFSSSDSGMNWKMERISDFISWAPTVCRTKESCYYIAVRGILEKKDQLWFSKRPIEKGFWESPNVITKSFGSDYVAIAETDTVHLCWLDSQHEKASGNPVYPRRGNYEVAYSLRKDSDTSWSKAVVLSKGMGYSFAPTMSVDGDKIVVAWAGTETCPNWYTQSDPNDIFYVTSKDGGKSWSKPLNVTKGAKDGITSGTPTIALQNGMIHLCYAQGKMNLKQQSPGLTKLNQPPWPIYYQHARFPD